MVKIQRLNWFTKPLQNEKTLYTQNNNMKSKLLALSLISILFISSCGSSNQITAVGSFETKEEFTVYARYTESATLVVESFLDSAFKKKISLGIKAETPVKLNNGEKVNIRSEEGQIEIVYLKKDSTSQGYAAVKKLGYDLSKKLAPSVKY
jgi:hypothetical protein